MRQHISTFIAFAVFLSVAGYLIPCTLHCLNSSSGHGSGHGHGHTHAQAQMDNGHVQSEHDHGTHQACDGMCSTEQTSNKTSEHTSASPMHQAQFMAQMLTATLSIDLNLAMVDPGGIMDSKLDVKTLLASKTPPVPPPQHVFLHI